LDSPTLLAAPRGWVAVFVVMIVMTGFVVWSFVGRLPLTVSGIGLLTHPLGVTAVQSTYQGIVVDVLVDPGDEVDAGQELVRLTDGLGQRQAVTSPFRGIAVAVSVAGGQVLSVGTPVASVERRDAPDDRLVAMLFVPADESVGVAPGDPAQLAVSSAPPQAFGLLRGRVRSISPYPLTAQALIGLLGDPLAVQTYVRGGAPRQVVVDLIPDPTTRSGFAWTSTGGPPYALRSQVKTVGTIVLGAKSPVSFILNR
jgi:multidrug efflux pump subunit AcrA (membrane-fusion protein)